MPHFTYTALRKAVGNVLVAQMVKLAVKKLKVLADVVPAVAVARITKTTKLKKFKTPQFFKKHLQAHFSQDLRLSAIVK